MDTELILAKSTALGYKLGFTSVIIHQLRNYIPNDDRHLSLLPHAEVMFKNEDPNRMCAIIKNLSPVRLYVCGNHLQISSEWSKLMISDEVDVMDDEDNWCAFLENEQVESEIKWNFAFMFGRSWKVSRISALDINQLEDNPRFYSAVRRAHTTLAERQVDATAEILDWHSICLQLGYIKEEPTLSVDQKTLKISRYKRGTNILLRRQHAFQNLSSFDYNRLGSAKNKMITFIWLDEILCEAESQLQCAIEPFKWQFFNTLSSCVSFIETQLREQRYIFLVASGSQGNELFLGGLCLIDQLFSAYIYCAHLGPHLEWTQDYSKIRGTYNDSTTLANHIKRDYEQLKTNLGIDERDWCSLAHNSCANTNTETTEEPYSPSRTPITVYDPLQPDSFLAYQRTIDSLLCLPHTSESQAEMVTEFRRIFKDNENILAEIDTFENTYHSNNAVHWFTRDCFVYRVINQALRSSDAEVMFRLRHILTDLYTHLNESYRQAHGFFSTATMETFYRGQVMSTEEFDYFKVLRGSIISVNTFLSATKSMQIAMMYAGKFLEDSNLISVVIIIEADPRTFTRPYADISHYSLFNDEDETLFAMGSVFRIGNIRQLNNDNNIWTIQLKTINEEDYRFNKNTAISD